MPRPASDPFRDRPVPAWYRDSKFGIFIHWGVYSVPAWAPIPTEPEFSFEAAAKLLPKRPTNANELWAGLRQVAPELLSREIAIESPYAEWYLNSLNNEVTQTAARHADLYGDRDYKSFAADFATASSAWNASTWGELFSRAGARYAILTSKHHDGYCLWPTNTPNPLDPHWFSKRDLVGEYVAAMRASGIRPGIYYSGGLDWSLRGVGAKSIDDLNKGVVQSEPERSYMDAHIREIVHRYEPDVLWGDIAYPRDSDVHALHREYYETVPDGLVNDRFVTAIGEMDRHYDYVTTEYFVPGAIHDEVWEVCEGIGPSFAYNQDEDDHNIKSSQEIVALLADAVSKNGNLLLGVGPRADGSVPELQAQRLEDVGAWLRVNGEAIYETRPWTVHTATIRGAESIHFTSSGTSVYAIVIAPTATQIEISNVDFSSVVSVAQLGSARTPTFEHSQNGLIVDDTDPSGGIGFALKLETAAHH